MRVVFVDHRFSDVQIFPSYPFSKKVCDRGFFPGDEVYVNEGPRSRTKMCKSCVLNRFHTPDPEDNVRDQIRELYGDVYN